jgi:hypothetical protein
VERLAVVGRELTRKGARLAVIGTRAEQPLADRLVATLDGDAADLTGHLGLGGLAGLLERACCSATTPDPGTWPPPARPPSPSTGGSASAATGHFPRARHRAPTAWQLHCPVCGAHGLHHDCRSSHEASFVADVTTDEVLAEALDLLATETTRASAG